MSEHVPGRVAPTRVLLVACFGAFLAFLDATIVNVAFPSIRESFPERLDRRAVVGAQRLQHRASRRSWSSCGRLTDLIGRRRAYVARHRAVHPGVGAVRGRRLARAAGRRPASLQALGAAMLVPASLALVIEAFPSDRRAHAIGLWGATAAVAAGLGPPMGGALVELGGWRWAFLVNLPFGVRRHRGHPPYARGEPGAGPPA